ncbi:roadblock/LC7 domain-containing protein [Streptomyces sodiiphilus]|uniref:Roadblock/LC7 domain-containing protein n=1 Tax=Streptomyces sodiiphilus TaxID=226217 RepID=A0ABN2PWC7_9ACTN
MTAPEPAAWQDNSPSGDSAELDWLLDDLVTRVAGVQHALALSADGLARGCSRTLGRDAAEHLAAVASGFHSLAKGVGRHFETGGVRHTLIELDTAYLCVAAAGSGSCLAVFAETEADVGQIAYEIALLVKKVGPHLTTPPREEPSGF